MARATWAESSSSRWGASSTPRSAASPAIARNGVMPPTRTMFGCTTSTTPASMNSAKR